MPLFLGLLAAVATGVIMPLQARVNGGLAVDLGDGLLAAVFSFGGAFLIMAIATFSTPHGRRSLSLMVTQTRAGAIPWYYHAVGILGAYFVLSQTYFVPLLGLAIYTVAVVTGQTTAGLLVDRIGLGPGGSRRITPARVLGVSLTIVAVIWAVSPRITPGAEVLPLILPVVVIFFAGFLMSFHHAINGTVAAAIRSPVPVTLANYLVGTVVLLTAWLIKNAVDGTTPTLTGNLWLYTGSVFGCVILVASAFLVRRVGVLLTGLGMIGGQLVGSLLLDWLLPLEGSVVELVTVLGTALTLLAIVISSLPWPRTTRPA